MKKVRVIVGDSGVLYTTYYLFTNQELTMIPIETTHPCSVLTVTVEPFKFEA